MNQESFRELLQTPKAVSSTRSTSSSLLTGTSKVKSKTVESSQPSFKPRTVKKKALNYRDRAAERREGLGNDYAQVEALAEDFEKRTVDNADRAAVEEQRRYLGGDSEHTVLVKGLDLALLEQNKARLATSSAADDDTSLEQAFREAASSAPRKRTREEIVQELKAKRAKTAGDAALTEAGQKTVDDALENAKKAGKFRPIGFKPFGASSGDKPKKKKGKVKAGGQEGEVTCGKKTKEPAGEAPPSSEREPSASDITALSVPSSKTVPQDKPGPADHDFDIFAGAGEYTGVDVSDEDGSENDVRPDEQEEGEPEEAPPRSKGRWFGMEGEEGSVSLPRVADVRASPSPPVEAERLQSATALSDKEDGQEEERPMRLQPLASSAIPSIRELLEMDASTGKGGKRGGRKGKKKEKIAEGGIDKSKIDRDYQRLKAYTDKKAAAGGR